MNILSKYYNSAYDLAKHRIMKVFGISTRTADQLAPFGIDSCPPQGADVIYMETTNDDQPVIIGVINTGMLATEGETRVYSLKKNPETGAITQVVAFYAWARTDGTYELGGVADNLVRYAKLNQALQSEVTLLNAELQKIQIAISSLGGMYTRQSVTLDISQSKITEIKTL